MNNPSAAFSSLPNIDEYQAREIKREFGSPVFLYDIDGMLGWFHQLQSSARKLYEHSTVAVSVKTNPLAGLLQRLVENGADAEVISGDEYQIARHLNVPNARIIFNGPAKRDEELEEAIQGGCRIHCDHPDEIDRIEEIAARENLIVQIGIRVYMDRPDNFNRFGFCIGSNLDDCEATKAVERITGSSSLSLGGIHSHIGTNIRDQGRFRQLGNDLHDFAMFIRKRFSFDLHWINVGGGLAGISPTNHEASETESWPVASAADYTEAVITPLLPVLQSSTTNTRLLFEPGRALFDPWGGLLTTVVGRRPETNESPRSVILDAGITSLALAEKFNHPLKVCKAATGEKTMTRFLGPTCMQRDEVHRPMPTVDLVRGDHILFHGTGGYSMTLAIPFVNFRNGVVGWEGDEMFWLRKPETLESKMALEQTSLTSNVTG